MGLGAPGDARKYSGSGSESISAFAFGFFDPDSDSDPDVLGDSSIFGAANGKRVGEPDLTKTQVELQ